MEGEIVRREGGKRGMAGVQETHLFQMALSSRREGRNFEWSPTDSPHLQSTTGQEQC